MSRMKIFLETATDSAAETLIWSAYGLTGRTVNDAAWDDLASDIATALDKIIEHGDAKVLRMVYADPEGFGHDFTLTRNREGAGFWDGGWGDYGDLLTTIAQEAGEVHAWVREDGVFFTER